MYIRTFGMGNSANGMSVLCLSEPLSRSADVETVIQRGRGSSYKIRSHSKDLPTGCYHFIVASTTVARQMLADDIMAS